MVTFNGKYLGVLRTETTHGPSSSKLITDAPTDNHGKGETYSPTDLVATALATCMLTIMGIRAQKKGLNLEGMTYQVEKHMESNPRRIGEVKIHFHLPNSTLSDEQKEELKEAALNCPVALSVSSDLKQSVTFDL